MRSGPKERKETGKKGKDESQSFRKEILNIQPQGEAVYWTEKDSARGKTLVGKGKGGGEEKGNQTRTINILNIGEPKALDNC